MSTARVTESAVEEAALTWFEDLGYTVLHGPDIAPGEPAAERAAYNEVVLQDRLRTAIARINPTIPSETLAEALGKVLRAEHPSLYGNNHRFHAFLTEGVDVEYRRSDGTIAGDKVGLVDFAEPGNNDWLAVNQYTVEEKPHARRPDLVVFVNGLPLAVIELKNPADEDATIWTAFNQLQTYKQQIPSLFAYNEALIVSDGLEARVGALTANREWFLPWRTIEGEALAPASML